MFQVLSSCMWPVATLMDGTAQGQRASPNVLLSKYTLPPRLTCYWNL